MQQRLIRFVMVLAAITPAFGTVFSSLSTDDSNFGLLGGTISNTGTGTAPAPTGSYVVGDVGSASTITGFAAVPPGGPGTASGFVCTETGPASCTGAEETAVGSGYGAFLTDYTAALDLPSTPGTFSGGTQTFMGSTGNNVYASSGTVSTATSGIALTFDAQGLPNVVFVIQINGSLTVNNAITFNLLNGALASNIYWIIGGADGTLATGVGNATIDPGANPITWDGNILAGSPNGPGGTFTMSAKTGGSGLLAGTINGCVFTDGVNTLAGITDVNGCFATGTPEPGSAELVGLGGLLGAGLLSIRARGRLRA